MRTPGSARGAARKGGPYRHAHPRFLRDKAIELRTKKKLTIDEIAERLALSRQTIYYWVKDIGIDRKPATSWPATAGAAAARSNRRRFKKLREEAYERGVDEYENLSEDPQFREFLSLYMAEGYKRSRNTVAICNSDVAILLVARRFMKELSNRKLSYSIQYHADQDLEELREYWAAHLGIRPDEISVHLKSNSNQLAKRTYRSRYGVLTIRTSDTYFRARLQAWLDIIRQEWLADSLLGEPVRN